MPVAIKRNSWKFRDGVKRVLCLLTSNSFQGSIGDMTQQLCYLQLFLLVTGGSSRTSNYWRVKHQSVVRRLIIGIDLEIDWPLDPRRHKPTPK